MWPHDFKDQKLFPVAAVFVPHMDTNQVSLTCEAKSRSNIFGIPNMERDSVPP